MVKIIVKVWWKSWIIITILYLRRILLQQNKRNDVYKVTGNITEKQNGLVDFFYLNASLVVGVMICRELNAYDGNI